MERDQASKFVNDLLRLMVSRNGSDLFLTADFPPAIKVDGKVTKESAKASERMKGKGEEIAGSIKRKVGALIDDENLEAMGAAQKELGKARQAANR